MPDRLQEAITAHREALAARVRLDQLASERNDAICAALESGVSAIQLADQLGITRQRVYAMARSAQNHE